MVIVAQSSLKFMSHHLMQQTSSNSVNSRNVTQKYAREDAIVHRVLMISVAEINIIFHPPTSYYTMCKSMTAVDYSRNWS